MVTRTAVLKIAVLLLMFDVTVLAGQGYESNPFVIKLDIPAPKDSSGGIIIADVNNDEKMDYQFF